MDKAQDRTEKVSPSWFMRIIFLLIIIACIQAFARENSLQTSPSSWLNIKILDLNNGLILLLTWSAAVVARRQFLISIRPHLTYPSEWHPGGKEVALSSEKRVWVVHLQNTGPGSAFLNHAAYSINDGPRKDYERIVEVLRNKGYKINIDYKLVRFSPGAAISTDKERLVFAGTEDFIKNINMQVDVEYEGIIEYSLLKTIRCYPSQAERPDTQLYIPSSHQSECLGIMSEIDVAKEQIAYLKFWLGVMVITDISLFGWLISNAGSTSLHLLVGGCLAVIAITVGIVLLHRRIERQIQELRGL